MDSRMGIREYSNNDIMLGEIRKKKYNADRI